MCFFMASIKIYTRSSYICNTTVLLLACCIAIWSRFKHLTHFAMGIIQFILLKMFHSYPKKVQHFTVHCCAFSISQFSTQMVFFHMLWKQRICNANEEERGWKYIELIWVFYFCSFDDAFAVCKWMFLGVAYTNAHV